MDELLDIVDEQDKVIGQKWRSEIYADRQNYIIRGVWLFIINDQGQLWIPRRSANKQILPQALDASACGHVGAGESYEQALIREVQEELNIDLTKIYYQQVAYIGPEIKEIQLFTKVYQISMNETPAYNREDFEEYFWLTPQELITKIDKGDRAKHYLPLIIKQLYLK